MIMNLAKRARERKQRRLAKRNSFASKQRISNFEPLEDRVLLAVTYDGNGENVTGTQQVMEDIVVPHGADAFLTFAVGYTDPGLGPTFEVEVDGAPLGGSPFAPVVTDMRSFDTNVPPDGNDDTTIFSAIYGVHLGTAAMDRVAKVTFTAGVSTDIVGDLGSYHGVSPTTPIKSFGASVPGPGFGLAIDHTVGPAGAVADDGILDMIFVKELTGSAISIAADGDQAERLNTPIMSPSVTMPGQMNIFHAGSSFEQGGAGDDSMKWSFNNPAGGAGAADGGAHVFATLTDCEVGPIDGGPDCTEVRYDAGDAPAPHPTLIADNGAIHAPKGPGIGDKRDDETDGQPNAVATGDDNTGAAGFFDEGANDGPSIVFETPIVSQKHDTNTGKVTIVVTGTDANSRLNAWLDFNDNGDWSDAGEKIFDGFDIGALGDGTHMLNYTIPVSAQVVTGTPFSRFRIHSEGVMGAPASIGFTGHQNDGEVEDLQVETLVGAEIHGTKYEDLDGDGVLDPGEPPFPGVVIGLTEKETETITFTNLSILAGNGVNETEGSYTFTAVNSHFDIVGVGDTPSAIDTSFGGTDPIVFTKTGGGTFSFDAYDIADSFDGPDNNDGDNVRFVGLLNGNVQFDFEDDDAGGDGSYSTVATGQANVQIDELRIQLGAAGVDETFVDNLVFGMLVQATDANGNPVANETTDANGDYWFVNLEEGDYIVTELLDQSDSNNDGIMDNLQGLVPSNPADGIINVTLASGQCLEDQDFLNYVEGSIHGRKFHDLNANGVNDNEPVLEGIRYKLRKKIGETLGNSGTVNELFSDPVFEVTDNHGLFWFTGLMPGEYELMEIVPNTLPQSSTPTTFRLTLESRDEYAWVAGARDANGDLIPARPTCDGQRGLCRRQRRYTG